MQKLNLNHVHFGVKSKILDATYVDRRLPHNLWSKNTNVKHVCDCTIQALSNIDQTIITLSLLISEGMGMYVLTQKPAFRYYIL